MMNIHDLPAVNASLNGLKCAVPDGGFCLHPAEKQDRPPDRTAAAFVTSIVFLACYLTYHTYLAVVLHQAPARFLHPLWFRPIYLTLLLTHTILAVVIVPMILVTLYRAKKERFELHKKIARWTWPLWMYVSVTGVVVYLLLYQIFPQAKP